MLALVPHLAAWGKLQIDNALARGRHQRRAAVGVDKLGQQGVLYDGLHVLGGGSILGGLILGAIAVFIIDRKFAKAAGFALAGAVLTFFGFMHGEKIGFGQIAGHGAQLPRRRDHPLQLLPLRRRRAGADARRRHRRPRRAQPLPAAE